MHLSLGHTDAAPFAKERLPQQAIPTSICGSKKRGVESSPVFLRKLAAAVALPGLLATSNVADSGLCSLVCASRAHMGGSLVTHDVHSPSHGAAHSSAHQHMSRDGDMRESVLLNAKVAPASPPCAQYQPLLALLNGSRASFGESISSTRCLANPPALSFGPNRAEIDRQVPSPSPPESNVPRLSASVLLRI